MTIALAYPVAGALFGPGYFWEVLNTVGPNPLDDYISINVTAGAGEIVGISSTYVTATNLLEAHDVLDAIITTQLELPQVGLVDFAKRMFNLIGQAPAGTSVDVQAVWRHHGGGLVAVAPTISCVWDPVGGLGQLALRLTSTDVGSALLNAILACVQRQFPNNA